MHIRFSPEEFLEDKDSARHVRLNTITPALASGDAVTLDFADVGDVTQGFIHALLSEPVARFGLERVEFKNCSPRVRAVIELAIEMMMPDPAQ